MNGVFLLAPSMPRIAALVTMDITLENLGRIYSWDWALRNVSATIHDGESVCILGENGSGKSTLLQMIGGVIRPTQGSVRIDEHRARRGAVTARRRMLLLHPDQPMMGKNVVTHLGAAISLFDRDEPGIEDVAAKWLETLKVPYVSTPQESVRLSRGQSMKLWMATLFTLRPHLWMLDEPHQSGLDAFGIEILEHEIRSHRDAGGIVVFTSQWPPHARRLADRLFLLHGNELVFDGTVEGLSNHIDTVDESLHAILRKLESDDVGV